MNDLTNACWDSKPAKAGWNALAEAIAEDARRIKHARKIRIFTRITVPIATTRETVMGVLDAASIAAIGFEPTFAEVADRDFCDTIRRALRTLDATDAECVRRRFGIDRDEASEREIARALGVSRTMVWNRLQRALPRLAKALKEYGHVG